MSITILNTSIITAFGNFSYREVTLEEAKGLVTSGFLSAVGHESTAEIISTLLGIDCPVNRINFKQQAGESALVFKLKGRPPEGRILSSEEIKDIGYSWGLLTMERELHADTNKQQGIIDGMEKLPHLKQFILSAHCLTNVDFEFARNELFKVADAMVGEGKDSKKILEAMGLRLYVATGTDIRELSRMLQGIASLKLERIIEINKLVTVLDESVLSALYNAEIIDFPIGAPALWHGNLQRIVDFVLSTIRDAEG